MLTSSHDFLYDNALASAYVAQRGADAAKLLSELEWRSHLTGVLRAKLYGHSILWDITGVLHAWDHRGKYEVLFNGEDDPDCSLTLEQLLACILAKNW